MNASIDFNVRGETISCELNSVINAGYTGRNQEAVREHIDELAEQGISGPNNVPTLYSVPTYMVLQNTDVQVEHSRTSGEAEWAMLYRGEGLSPLLTVASDHTDRALEAYSVTSAKQLSPNIVGTDAWMLDDIEDDIDSIALQSEVSQDGDWIALQSGQLGELISPISWLSRLQELNKLAPGTMLLGGTVPMRRPDIQFARRWRVRLLRPSGESLNLSYTIKMLAPSID